MLEEFFNPDLPKEEQFNLWYSSMEALEKIKQLNPGWDSAQRSDVVFTDDGKTVKMNMTLVFKDHNLTYSVVMSQLDL